MRKLFNISDKVTDGVIIGKIIDYRKLHNVYYYQIKNWDSIHYMIEEKLLLKVEK